MKHEQAAALRLVVAGAMMRDEISDKEIARQHFIGQLN